MRVTLETKEQYIPQVLNLEKLNGINYKKGCYTGQEIVARTHYLGKIKKQIFLISHNSKLINISNKIHDENNEILGEVISDNQTIQEKIICLAVIRLDAIEKDLYINNTKVNIIYVPLRISFIISLSIKSSFSESFIYFIEISLSSHR